MLGSILWSIKYIKNILIYLIYFINFSLELGGIYIFICFISDVSRL
jgi:hypothetical protein